VVSKMMSLSVMLRSRRFDVGKQSSGAQKHNGPLLALAGR
jgi:hypothetical protein